MKLSTLILSLILLSACTTIEINEDDAFDNHRTITPETFSNTTFSLENRTIDTDDGEQLDAWFLTRDDAMATVLYFGGNGFLMVKSRPLIETYSEIPVNFVLFDYRGYGLSSGEPSVEGIKRDARTIFTEVQALANESSHPVFIHGHSMGSFLSTYITEQNKVAGYVLESPITEVNSWTKKLVPWLLRPFIRFDINDQIASQNNVERVQSIEYPLLILGGSDDDITPFDMAQELYSISISAEKSIVEIDGGTHNDLPLFESYQSALREFYTSIYDR